MKDQKDPKVPHDALKMAVSSGDPEAFKKVLDLYSKDLNQGERREFLTSIKTAAEETLEELPSLGPKP